MPLDHAATAADLPAVPSAVDVVHGTLARVLRPRAVVQVSDWADRHRWVSSKASAKPGQWRTDRNPPLREPLNCLSVRSPVREMALMFPIQLGKTEVVLNGVGYGMCQDPGPIMVCLPGEVSREKWVMQKLQPMLDESPAVRAVLSSQNSREAANQKYFKDFEGGQLYLEHAGTPARLKSTSVRNLYVDEFDEFAANFTGGDDPGLMLDGRTSAFPNNGRRVYISSPQIKGASRIEGKWLQSDQRRYVVPCPHCGHEQHLQWGGLRWAAQRHPQHGRRTWYVCQDCGAEIEEHHKTAMIRAGHWRATNPLGTIRGYHINCLYYPVGLGPTWEDMAELWLSVQDDPAKLKTFVNDRLAEPWEDKTTARLKHEAIADRAESYALRTAPDGVLWVTVGVDTQDDRLECQIVGWGRWPAFWVLDYVVLWGDPAEQAVWDALAALLTTPIQHAWGCTIKPDAYAHDIAGHRMEDVKAFVRRARQRGVQRPLAIFGATQANAPVLGRGKPVDVTWQGATEKRGLHIHAVGTIAAKDRLFALLGADAERDEKHLQALQAEDAAARSAGRPTQPVEPPLRQCHFSAELPERYFPGLISERFDPKKARYVKLRGARNEPLDTWVYAFVAAHHPELRLHRMTEADIARRTVELRRRAGLATDATISPTTTNPPTADLRTSALAPAPGSTAAALPIQLPAPEDQPAQPAHPPIAPSLAALLAARRNRGARVR